jgi:putative ABC transport system substrate-binding protein
MKRRAFIAGLAGAAAAFPPAARAQQTAMPVVGFLHSSTLETARRSVIGFHRGLSETGYIEGRNVTIEYRFAENQADRLPALAADLSRRQVAVLFAGGPPAGGPI